EGTAAKLEEVRAALFGPKPDLTAARPAWRRGMLAFSGLILAAAGGIGLWLVGSALPAAVRAAPTRTIAGAALFAVGVLGLSGIWMPELLESIGIREPGAITETLSGLRDAVRSWGTAVAAVAGIVGYVFVATPMFRAREGRLYGAFGLLVFAGVIAGAFLGVALSPELVLARFVWALLVTYLLMCALFESFTYPFVIMFSVPLAIV